MAITVQSFDNVEQLVFSTDIVNQPQNQLFLITGVAILQPFSGTQQNQGNWTRDTCSFVVPGTDGKPFLFSNEVTASAIAFLATFQNVGSQDVGFGVDSVSTTVSPADINKQHTVTITARVVVRDTQGIVFRLGFQANVWARPPVR